MVSYVQNIAKQLFGADQFSRTKLLLLSISFFLLIGGYTVVRALKDSLFISIVGYEYIWQAKLWAMIVLIPGILLFSRLTDIMRRPNLVMLYSIIYGFGGLVIAYFLGHPSIGLANTIASPYRFFGWALYIFLEGYNPFVISLFWSFCHSITSPDEAKINYPIMVAASKLGGAALAFSACSILGNFLHADIFGHQIVLAIASLFLLCLPPMVYLLLTKIPSSYMHGYEAAYRADRIYQQEEKKRHGFRAFIQSLSSGLTLLIRYPYVLGIFGVVFFWEVISAVINFARLCEAKQSAATLCHQSIYVLQQDGIVHVVGFFITIFGTRLLIELLGERRSLLLVPIFNGLLLLYYFTSPSPFAMMIVFILARSINYAFASPLRESLYIPTTKEMKFKSKSWIDSFGTRVAKGVGSGYNGLVLPLAGIALTITNALFFSTIIALWVVTAHRLGKRYEKVIKDNKVIGLD